uniref:Uncharacterized protein n=1 Tax=Ascaris lumbricoides TaxID=6252 RepID=A0A0M3IIQ0_ASCLU
MHLIRSLTSVAFLSSHSSNIVAETVYLIIASYIIRIFLVSS